MGTQPTRLVRYLPQVAAATILVIGGPVLAILILRGSGVVTSPLPLLAVAVILSICFSYAGAACWMTRPGSGDLLFGDLMIWGWFRRWRVERRLTSAANLLGLTNHPTRHKAADLEPDRRAQLLERLAASLEARDPYTHGHSRRVARHASMIATRMGLRREQVARIRTAAAVHDVGKIETPTVILRKPGRLTDDEYAVVKQHSSAGAQMVSGLGDEELARIVRHHHERLDGMGYPDGLAGNEIPLGARIIAVADTFDALTSKRSYRSAMPHKKALALLSAEAGAQLDPDAVRAFSSYYSGHRLVALWALVAHGSQRLTASLGGGLNASGAATAAKVSVATFAAAVAASAVVQSPVAGQQPRGSGASGSVTQEALLVAVASPPAERSERVARTGDGDRGGSGSRRGDSEYRGSGSETPGVPSEGSPPPAGDGGGSTEPDPGPAGGPGPSAPSLPNSTATGPIRSTVEAVTSLPEKIGGLPQGSNLNSLLPKLPGLGSGRG